MLIKLIYIIVFLKNSQAVCDEKNIACNKTAIQSSTYGPDHLPASASLAVDGNFTNYLYSSKPDKFFCSHTWENDTNSWLQIDLGNFYFVEKITLLGRNEYDPSHRMDNFIILFSNVSMPNKESSVLCGQWSGSALVYANMTLYCSYQTKPARYIVVLQPSTYRGGALTVCELQAFGERYESLFECPVGLYGDGCTKVCHCFNGLPCNQGNGYCHNGCHQDWMGDTCDTYKKSINYENKDNCYYDFNNLTKLFNSQRSIMSVSMCVKLCKENGFIFAALYRGEDCHCGMEIISDKLKLQPTNCNVKCSGNINESCGANSNYSKNVYNVCPPNYFGFKCRFECKCKTGDTCRYPDGSCIAKNSSDENIQCKDNNWIAPTCHLRGCKVNQTCGVNATCNSIEINKDSFLYCDCHTGYSYKNEICLDIDECKIQPNICNSANQDCVNTVGSYECICKPGYHSERNSGRNPCQNINECLSNNTSCFENQTCIDNDGSYACIFKTILPNAQMSIVVWQIIVGVVLGIIFLIILVLLIVFLYLRYKRTNESSSTSTKVLNTTTNDADHMETSLEEENPYSKVNKKDFEEEFRNLPLKPLRSYDYGRLKENRPKNRFRNITPYDDNRLKLKLINDDPYSDYINATFIPTIDDEKVIATQGPNEDSIDDFWRMVDEYNVVVIAMLCNLKENYTVKCDQYWPSAGNETYGDLIVQLESETNWIDFIKRKLIFQSASGEVRTVIQYQFTGWPDHGVPDNVSSLLTMRNMIRNDNNNLNGLSLIHCSAGVGRTGCYIAIDSVLEARRTNKEISVFDFVNEMRNKRQQMVQTVEQYKFIYTTVSTHISTGLTVHTLQELSERFVNGGNAHTDYLLRNQWNILENCKRNHKNARNMKLNSIESMFSELVFTIQNKLTSDIWTNNKNLNQFILFADEKEADSIIPNLEKPIELSNERLTIQQSDKMEFGFQKILKKAQKEDATYANLQPNLYANSGNIVACLIQVYQITLKRFDHLDIKSLLNIYERLVEGKSLVMVIGTDLELTCYMMLAMFTLDAMRKRKYICIFQIIQHLYLKYKDFHVSEEAYIHLHKIMLQYK